MASTRRRRFWNYPRPNKGLVQRWLPSWRIVVGTILAVGAMGTGLFVAAFLSTTIPKGLDEVNQEATTVHYANGEEIGTFAEFKREKVEFASLPPHVGNAVVASEDETFWTNSGLDPKGIVRAAWNNLRNPGARQGASTLTQQYVERYYLDTTTSYSGKIREAIIALKIARSQPKEEVLGNYLNTIYWGRGMYGIQAASEEYFDKDAKDLTPSEAALLAGIIPSPVNWDPSINLEMAKSRWARTMERMADQGYITQDEFNEAKFPRFKPKKELTNSQGGQRGYILQAVKNELTKGKDAPFTEQELETRGLKITTTIRPKLQDAAVDVAKSLPDDAHKNVRPSIVSMDPRNGRILALYGGANYVKQPLNTALQDTAQGGSTFKPFTLIGALEEGYELSDTFDGNSPKVFPGLDEGGEDGNDDWEVDNFDYASYGSAIDLVKATANSVNSAYAELNVEIGPEKTAEVAHRAGIRDDSEIEPVPSNVLGIAHVYPIDLARAYSTIAAQGYKSTPHLVRKVETLAGDQVFEEDTSQEKVFDAQDMAATTYAMSKVVEEGSGEPASELGRPVAGKTGTSQLNKSAWFAGFIPQMTTVVGLRQYEVLDLKKGKVSGSATIEPFGGYEQITGGSWPVEAWTEFMKIATEDMEIEEFPEYVPPVPSFSPSPTPSPSESPELEWVEVPSWLVGQHITQVTHELEKLGFAVATPIAQPGEEPEGTVLDINPIGQAPYGATITLTVSTGQPEQPAQVPVPNVAGWQQRDAERELRAAGFQTNVVEENNDLPEGTVIATDPGGGAMADPESTVTLVVSLGPEDDGGIFPPPDETEEPPGNGNR